MAWMVFLSIGLDPSDVQINTLLQQDIKSYFDQNAKEKENGLSRLGNYNLYHNEIIICSHLHHPQTKHVC